MMNAPSPRYVSKRGWQSTFCAKDTSKHPRVYTLGKENWVHFVLKCTTDKNCGGYLCEAAEEESKSTMTILNSFTHLTSYLRPVESRMCF